MFIRTISSKFAYMLFHFRHTDCVTAIIPNSKKPLLYNYYRCIVGMGVGGMLFDKIEVSPLDPDRIGSMMPTDFRKGNKHERIPESGFKDLLGRP
jgi:hypothetical protein